MRLSLRWWLRAARRTVLAAVPSAAQPDDAWASEWLSPRELELFLLLPGSERDHGVAVGKCVAAALAADGLTDPELVRAAILHDIGKLNTPQAALGRVMAHVIPRRGLPPEPRLSGLPGVWQAQEHHANYGAQLLAGAGSSARVVALVAHHHDNSTSLPGLAYLRRCDEAT